MKLSKEHLEKMKKGRAKRKELYGKIIDIDDEISIFADKDQFILKYGTRECYFGYLEQCFQDIFSYSVKKRLILNEKKDMETIIEILKNTDKWLKSIFRKIESPKL